MKTLSIYFFVFFSIITSSFAQTKAYVDKQTKQFSLTSNMREDHKFFGYLEANVKAKKMIIFSIFTKDVDKNPYKCPLGAYYDTSGLNEGDEISFIAINGDFIKLNYTNAKKEVTPFFIRKKYIEFL